MLREHIVLLEFASRTKTPTARLLRRSFLKRVLHSTTRLIINRNRLSLTHWRRGGTLGDEERTRWWRRKARRPLRAAGARGAISVGVCSPRCARRPVARITDRARMAPTFPGRGRARAGTRRRWGARRPVGRVGVTSMEPADERGRSDRRNQHGLAVGRDGARRPFGSPGGYPQGVSRARERRGDARGYAARARSETDGDAHGESGRPRFASSRAC